MPDYIYPLLLFYLFASSREEKSTADSCPRHCTCPHKLAAKCTVPAINATSFQDPLYHDLITLTVQCAAGSNQSSHFVAGQFSQLALLQRLKLTNCHSNASLWPDDVFDRMISIRRITLENISGVVIKSKLFNPITLVKHVVLRRTSVEGPDFAVNLIQSIPQLEGLTINGQSWPILPKFPAATYVEFLDLSNNNIMHIPDDAFIEFDNLKRLHLAENELRDLSFLKRLKAPQKLEQLDFANNQLRTIPTRALQDCTSLQSLELDRNQLSTLDLISYPTSIEKLTISQNQITELTWGSQRKNLSRFDISSNRLTVLRRISNAPQLITANFSFNRIDHVEAYVLSEVQSGDVTLDLTGNKLPGSFDPSALLTQGQTIKVRLRLYNNPNVECPVSTRSVIIDDADRFACRAFVKPMELKPCPTPWINEYSFCSMKTCARRCCEQEDCICKQTCPLGSECAVNADTNDIQCIRSISGRLPDWTEWPQRVAQIFLRNLNNVTTLTANSFVQLDALELVSISKSQIRRIADSAFRNLENLKYIDITDCELESFTGNEVSDSTKVIELNLSNNKLRTALPWTNIRQNLPWLQSINLERNDLSELPFEILVDLKSERLRTATLGHNLYDCNCTTVLWLAKWTKDEKAKLIDSANITCQHQGTVYSYIPGADSNPHAEPPCGQSAGHRSHHGSSIGSALAIVFAVLLVFVVITLAGAVICRHLDKNNMRHGVGNGTRYDPMEMRYTGR